MEFVHGKSVQNYRPLLRYPKKRDIFGQFIYFFVPLQVNTP